MSYPNGFISLEDEEEVLRVQMTGGGSTQDISFHRYVSTSHSQQQQGNSIL